ncbi:MAG: hypothetical protein ABH810_03140 [bacterium]
MQEEKEFYKELDDNRVHKKEKTLSPWTLVVFFIIFITVLEVLVFYVGGSLKKTTDDDFTKATEVSSGVDLIGGSQDSSGNSINIPEGLLCSKIAQKVSGEIKCSIDSEAIRISGKISALLPANSTVSFVPEIKNGEAKQKLTEVRIGAVKTGRFLAGPLESQANNALKAAITDQKVTITRIDLEEGIMVIKAQTNADKISL